MEANQTERAKAIVDTDGDVCYVFARGMERMEMRYASRLRKKQYSRTDTGYPAYPGSATCLAANGLGG